MSYVVTVKRVAQKPPLNAQDFARLIGGDDSLSSGGQETIWWTDPTSGRRHYINLAPESGDLWTDDMPQEKEGICRFLDKLRSMARSLDARVFGEGEDITEAREEIPPGPLSFMQIALAFLVILGSFVIMPFLLLWLVVRLLWTFLIKIPLLDRFK